MPLKFDISSENFDHYFAIQSAGLGEIQKELLPKELTYKIFSKGGKKGSTSTSKLSFLAKIFVLIKALRKRVLILVEDESGMDEETYFKYRGKLPKKNNITVENAKELVSDVTFVLANKEVMDTYSYMNLLSASKPYNYLTKGKNSMGNKTAQAISEQNYICRFISYYESNRKTIALKTGINMSEWLVLIYLYHGNEMESSPIHKDWYKYSFNSSKTKIKLAFSTLQSKGYIEKTGFTKSTKFKITPLGRLKTTELLNKYVVNC